MLSLTPSPPDVETLRIYLILPFYHEFVNSKHQEKLHTTFSRAVQKLSEIPRRIVCKWWAETSLEYFEHLVINYKNVVAYIVSFKMLPNPNGKSEKRVSK